MKLLASIAAPCLIIGLWAAPAAAHAYGTTTTCAPTTTTTQPATTTTEAATTTTAVEATTSSTRVQGVTSTIAQATTSFPENHPGGGEDRPTTVGPVSTVGGTPNGQGTLPHTGTGLGVAIGGAVMLAAGLALSVGKRNRER